MCRVKIFLINFLFIKSVVNEELNKNIEDLNLPQSHISQYFNNLAHFSKNFLQDSKGTVKEFLESSVYDKEICWGYERGCKKAQTVHRCPGNHTGYVASKEIQLDVFYSQADFGYVKEQLNEMTLLCEPFLKADSSLECSDFLRFCRGRNILLNLTNISERKEPFRWDINVLKRGEIGGYCRFHEELLHAQAQHISALQSWGPELRNFVSLDQRPIESDLCDVVVEKPTFIMKIDSTSNMYHHFCDFFNLYVSQHVNFSHPASFSVDIQILIWETHDYWSPFKDTFKAFTKNKIWNLSHLSGQVVCFRNVVLPLLPRMIYGLFYNTVLINGCENSALFHAFSEHVLHRLQVKEELPRKDRKVRITFLARNTKYRNVLNEKELLKRISTNKDYEVKRVVFDQNIKFVDQLKITRNSDVFIGIHGAGLTHLLFLPKWATLFELHHCGDPNCYGDLARLRGVNYLTWEDDSFLERFEAGYKDPAHEKFQNYKFDADEFARLVAKAVKAVKNNGHYKEYLKRSENNYREEL